MAITGMTGAVYVSDVDTAPVPFLGKPTLAGADLKRYQVVDEGCRYFAPDKPVTVEVNGSPVVAGFKIEPAGALLFLMSLSRLRMS